MKILCFFPLPKLYCDSKAYGGGERHFIKLCNHWAKLGNEIHVVTSKYASHLFEMSGLKVPIYIFIPTINLPIIVDFLNAIKMLHSVPNIDFDFIYCPNEHFSHLLPCMLAKKKLKIPLITSINLFHPDEINVLSSFKLALDEFSYYNSFRKLRAASVVTFKIFARNLLLRKADLIFPISNYVKKLLVKMGINAKRIFSVGCGINYDYIQTIEPDGKVYHACYMGAIIPRKGVFDLVKLWKEITNKEPEAKLLILGDGDKEYVDKFKESIRKHNLQNNVMMPGFKIGEEKYKLLKSSQIFIFPSYSESFAQSICEAMACGLPVIAYDLPPYHEFYKDDIVYVKRGDINGLIGAAVVLLDDDELKKKLKERGLKRSRKYSWNKIAMYELEIISQFLKIQRAHAFV